MAIEILPKHIQETLVALYLRLNGFFTSGHILHATAEDLAIRQHGDIDVFAIRLPFSAEPETGVPPSEHLRITNGVLEIIIGEVKSGREPIQFNETIRDPLNMIRVLRRAGFTNNVQTLERVTQVLTNQMVPKAINRSEDRIEELLPPEDDILYPTRIRPVIFHLGHPLPRRNQAWFVGYEEIMDNIWKRLRPELQPDSCQRVYDYYLWGPVFDALVNYFKSPKRTTPGTPLELLHEFLPGGGGAAEALGAQSRV